MFRVSIYSYCSLVFGKYEYFSNFREGKIYYAFLDGMKSNEILAEVIWHNILKFHVYISITKTKLDQ